MFRARATSVAAATATLIGQLAACAPAHVALAPTLPTASYGERAAAYERLRPLGESRTVSVYATQNSVTVIDSSFLQLPDGSRVYYPEDLGPVVRADSATARAIREYEDAKGSASGWRIATIAGLVGGLVLTVVGAGTAFDSENGSDAGAIALFSGLGLVTLSPFGLIPSIIYEQRATDARQSAFMTYDPSLRTALNLCADGTRLVDCGAPLPPAPPVPSAAPGVVGTPAGDLSPPP